MSIFKKHQFSNAIAIQDYNLSEVERKELNELIDLELVVRCDKIEHHPRMINPSYTYVSNDAIGRRYAKEVPLFTG